MNEISNKTFKTVTNEIDIADRSSKEELCDLIMNKLKFLFVKKSKYVLQLKQGIRLLNVNQILNSYVSFVVDEIRIEKSIISVKNFFIYTDIISDSFYNNQRQPILRVITPKGQVGDNHNILFDRPYFETINKTRLCKIYIKITDQNNQIVNFHSGPIVLKLEIKKIR